MATGNDPDGSDELLANLGWVRRLAVAIARDPDTADDLLQQAAGEWLTQRPAWATHGSGLRRWFARVVRVRAVDHFRAERARSRREAAVVPPPVEAPDAIVERLERQRRVAAAVQSLAEPYRTTLLHRYLEERSTAEVAALLGVPEATVRKRVERGLELLRIHLSAEYRSPARAVALALLDPALRHRLTASTGTVTAASLWFGTALMSTKIAISSAVLAAGVVAALWLQSDPDPAPVAVGGQGVVVSAAAAAARAVEPPVDPATAPAADRSVVSTPPASATAPRVAGLIFVDGERRAPADLAIEVADDAGAAQVDSRNATWSLTTAAAAEQPVSLWVTSATTAPARIPVPREAFASGAFDLALTTGRTLALTFVDRTTRAPLADLVFEIDKSLELEHSGGRVLMRSATTSHRTDRDGMAILTGVPEQGALAVRTDLVVREHRLVMRNGTVLPLRRPGPPVWSDRLTTASPQRIEVTIATERPLGEAFAAGTVPGWALTNGDRASVLVMAKELPLHDGQPGDTGVLPCGDDGRFTVRATAPSRHVVWLEATAGRNRLSAETTVVFDHQGAHAPVVFTPLAATAVRLHCTGLPPVGTLVVAAGDDHAPSRAQSHPCNGGERDLELQLAAGESVTLRLRADNTDGPGETGYVRRLSAAELHRGVRTVDLSGSFRDLELTAADGLLATVQAVALCRVQDGIVTIDQVALSPCRDGRATEPVFLPPGRWFWRTIAQGPVVLGGVVDVRPGDGGKLALVGETQHVPAADPAVAIQLDEVDGVSLRELPASLRTVPVAGAGVTLPRRAVWSPAGR